MEFIKQMIPSLFSGKALAFACGSAMLVLAGAAHAGNVDPVYYSVAPTISGADTGAFFYGELTVNGALPQTGVEIAIFNTSGTLCGATGVDASGNGGFGFDYAADDSSTGAVVECFNPGDELVFEVYDPNVGTTASGTKLAFSTPSFGTPNPTDPPTYLGANTSNGFNISATVVLNESPVADDASFTTNEDTPFNDALTGSDPVEGDPITYAIATNGSLGTAVIDNADTGAFTYTPNSDVNGVDTFTFVTNDGTSNSEPGTITITLTPQNDAPSSTDASFTTDEDTTGLSTPNIVDVDLDYEGDSYTFAITAQPTNGTASVVGNQLQYVPDANFEGDDSFSYSVTDSGAEVVSGTATVTVNAVSDAPSNDSAPLVSGSPAEGQSLNATDGGWTNNSNPVDTIIYTYQWYRDADGVIGGESAISLATGNSYTLVSADVDQYVRIGITATANGESTQAFSAFVYIPNTPPVIVQSGPLTVNVDEDLTPTSWIAPTVSAGDVNSSDVLAWSVLSGYEASNGTASVSGTGPSPTTLTYAPNTNYNGSDSFIVQVSDGSNTDTIVINVNIASINDAPTNTGVPVISGTAEEGQVLGTDNGSWTDNSVPNVSPLTYAYQWYRDTDTSAGGEVAISGATTNSYTVASADLGMYLKVGVVAIDNGDSAAEVFSAYTTLVPNTPPVIDQAGPLSVIMDEDGSPLAWVVPVLSATDPNSGQTLSWSVSSAASKGTATVSGNGSSPTTFTYVPNGNYNGGDSFTVEVSDSVTTDSIVVNVTVNSVNDAPTATSVSTIVTDEDTASVGADPIVTDVDSALEGDAFTFGIVTQPANGTASVVGNQLVYTPDADFNGSDSFTYRATDSGSAYVDGTANVTVNFVDDAPTNTVLPAISGTAEEGQVLVTDDGSWTDNSAPNVSVITHAYQWYRDTDTSAGGEVAISGATTNSYMVASADLGYYLKVGVVATDNGDSSAEVFSAYTSLVPNTLPVIDQTGPLSVSMDEDGSPIAWVPPTLSVTDPNLGQTLTWRVLPGSEASHGVATVNGNGSTPTICNYVPSAHYNGSDSFTVEVSDGVDSDTIIVNVTVDAVNDAPTSTSAADIVLDEDTISGGVTPTVTDIDVSREGDSFIFTIESQPGYGSAGIVANQLVYSGNSDFNGSDSFTYRATDSGGASVVGTANVTVNFIDDAPTNTAAPLIAGTAEDGQVLNTDNGSWSDNSFPDVTPISYAYQWYRDADTAAGGEVTITGATSSSYMVASDDVGYYLKVGVVATDNGDSAAEVFSAYTALVPNALPVIDQAGPLSVVMDEDGVPTGWSAPLLSASDLNAGQLLSWSIAPGGGATHGTATVSGTGASPSTLNYVPGSRYNGSDSFTVQVSDGVDSDSIVINVTINPSNDSDDDGVRNYYDAFPNDPAASVDRDGDGYPDVWNAGKTIAHSTTGLSLDDFPLDASEWLDTDGDGVGDNSDLYPNDPSESRDSDGDGVGDNADAYPSDPAASVDSDGDGYPDDWNTGKTQADSTTGLVLDVFPSDSAEWRDSDGDGIGDNSDAFPNDPGETSDTDGDGAGDSVDAYVTDPAASVDTDGDGYPNVWNAGKTQADSTTGLSLDVFPSNPNEWADSDGDLVGDNGDAFPNDVAASIDSDGDGYPNAWNIGLGQEYSTTGLVLDAFPEDATEWIDSDGDGVGDNSDAFPNDPLYILDADGDYLPDEWEEAVGLSTSFDNSATDSDADGVFDSEEFALSSHPLLLDSDADGLSDGAEVRSGTNLLLDNATLPDSDGDGMPDSYEASFGLDPYVANGSGSDSDNDGYSDYHEYLYGLDPLLESSDVDADGDGVLAAIEEVLGMDKDVNDIALDLDGDGLTNLEEVASGTLPTIDNTTLADSDADGIPDHTEVLAGTDPQVDNKFGDRDSDGLSDYIEYRNGTLAKDNADLIDSDGDKIPDFWELANGLDPGVSNDTVDSDGDGWDDLVEYLRGHDPNRSDLSFVSTQIGIYQDGIWYLDANQSWDWNGTEPGNDILGEFGIGLVGEVPVTGDWNGDGVTDIGVYLDGIWYLDMNNNWQWDGEEVDVKGVFGIGLTGEVPVTGDWNGDGITEIGVYLDGIWYLEANRSWEWEGEETDTYGVFGIGLVGEVPVAGDWNGDGITEIGVYLDGIWYLDANRSWEWEGDQVDTYGVFGIGLTGEVPVAGDWNGDGITEIGVYLDGIWYLDANRSWEWEGDQVDTYGVFGIGLAGEEPVVGNW